MQHSLLLEKVARPMDVNGTNEEVANDNGVIGVCRCPENDFYVLERGIAALLKLCQTPYAYCFFATSRMIFTTRRPSQSDLSRTISYCSISRGSNR